MSNKLNHDPGTLKQLNYGIKNLSDALDSLKLASACFYNVWQDSGGKFDGGVLVTAYIRADMYKKDCAKTLWQLKKIKGGD